MFGFLRQWNKHRVKDRLSLYLDGRLAPGEKTKVESHLNTCAACREELESLRATVDALRRLPAMSPPRPFVLPSARPAPRPVVFYRLRVATVVVAVLLVAFVSSDTLGLFPKPLAQTSPPVIALAPRQTPAPTPSPAAPSAAVPPVAAPVSPLQGAAVTPEPTPVATPAPQAQPRPMIAAPMKQAAEATQPPQTASTDANTAMSPPVPGAVPSPTGTAQPGPLGGPGPAGAVGPTAAPTVTPPAPQPVPEGTPEAPTPQAAKAPAGGDQTFETLIRESEIGLGILAALMAAATVYAWKKAKRKS